MAQIPPFDPIQYLVGRRFPTLFGLLRMPPGTKGINQGDKDKLLAQVKTYKEELAAKSETEINALVAEEEAKAIEESKAVAQAEEQARFFNLPWSVADFEYWSKATYWTLDEAVALSFGKSPEAVNWKSVEPFCKISPFAIQYRRRRDLAIRAKEFGQLYDHVLPGIFLAWAKRSDLSVPLDLVNAVEARGIQVADWKTMYDNEAAAHIKSREDSHNLLLTTMESSRTQFTEIIDKWKVALADKVAEIENLQSELAELRSKQDADCGNKPTEAAKPLGQRERESMLRLIIGMAIKGYAHNVSAARTSTAKEISDDLQKLGIGLDEDTVRKYLQEGKDLVPPSETE